MTTRSVAVLPAGVTVPTVRPAPVRAVAAAVCVCPTTFGTATFGAVMVGVQAPNARWVDRINPIKTSRHDVHRNPIFDLIRKSSPL